MHYKVQYLAIACLMAGCHLIQTAIVPISQDTVPGQADGNSDNQASDVNQGIENTNSSGLEPVPVESRTTQSGALKDACVEMCEVRCDENEDLECEFIADNIPVMCDGKRKECKAACDEKCLCQGTCGCNNAQGCEDECSQACFLQVKDVVGSEDGEEDASTTLAPPEGSVIYKKVDEEDMPDDGLLKR